MKRLTPLLFIALLATFPARAAADAAVGARLVEAKGCETCHARQDLHGAKAIYLRKDRKVGSLDELKEQVGMCNHGLHLGLSANEERDVVAYLNETYYRFK